MPVVLSSCMLISDGTAQRLLARISCPLEVQQHAKDISCGQLSAFSYPQSKTDTVKKKKYFLNNNDLKNIYNVMFLFPHGELITPLDPNTRIGGYN